jgi:curved DNA-binding protein CbpA
VWRELCGVTDYFALLQQPRKPWLDPDALKQKYQQLAFTAHPDRAGANEPSSDFGAITEGYRVLRDHKLRLQHLLELEGCTIAGNASLPDALIDLFSEVGRFVQNADQLVAQFASAGNALSKSLLRQQTLEEQREAQTLVDKLQHLQTQALRQLRALNESWPSKEAVAQVRNLRQQFAYVTRWIDQITERQFRLSHP